MTNDEAVKELIEAGATREKKETGDGVTKSGWWMDAVWLGPLSRPVDALAALKG